MENSQNLDKLLLDLSKGLKCDLQELPMGESTPLSLYEQKASPLSGSFLLEVGEGHSYAYVGIEPLLIFEAIGSHVKALYSGKAYHYEGDPFDALKKICEAASPAPFVGVMSYEASGVIEKLSDPVGEAVVPDLLFMLHRQSYYFDYASAKIICRQYPLEAQLEFTPCRAKGQAAPLGGESLNDAEFCGKVERAKQYILKGDAFQIVLSRAFTQPYKGRPIDLYKRVHSTAPTPYMYLFEGCDFGFAGASPERLVKVGAGVVETMPIAGTRGRNSHDSIEEVERELRNDPKETAEHMMLVDLGRNDIGKVAEIGTVTVTQLMQAKHYPLISHLVSKVQGRLKESLDIFDALKAVFPAGTLSGAPKIRAMEIIHALEGNRRGLYGGAVVFIQDSLNCDACIAIRTAFFAGDTVSVRAGAGIVYDSSPHKEAEETRHKSKGILLALKTLEERHVGHHR